MNSKLLKSSLLLLMISNIFAFKTGLIDENISASSLGSIEGKGINCTKTGTDKKASPKSDSNNSQLVADDNDGIQEEKHFETLSLNFLSKPNSNLHNLKNAPNSLERENHEEYLREGKEKKKDFLQEKIKKFISNIVATNKLNTLTADESKLNEVTRSLTGRCPSQFICVNWQLCSNGHIIVDGSAFIDNEIEEIPEKNTDKVCGINMVCCKGCTCGSKIDERKPNLKTVPLELNSENGKKLGNSVNNAIEASILTLPELFREKEKSLVNADAKVDPENVNTFSSKFINNANLQNEINNFDVEKLRSLVPPETDTSERYFNQPSNEGFSNQGNDELDNFVKSIHLIPKNLQEQPSLIQVSEKNKFGEFAGFSKQIQPDFLNYYLPPPEETAQGTNVPEIKGLYELPAEETIPISEQVIPFEKAIPEIEDGDDVNPILIYNRPLVKTKFIVRSNEKNEANLGKDAELNDNLIPAVHKIKSQNVEISNEKSSLISSDNNKPEKHTIRESGSVVIATDNNDLSNKHDNENSVQNKFIKIKGIHKLKNDNFLDNNPKPVTKTSETSNTEHSHENNEIRDYANDEKKIKTSNRKVQNGFTTTGEEALKNHHQRLNSDTVVDIVKNLDIDKRKLSENLPDKVIKEFRNPSPQEESLNKHQQNTVFSDQNKKELFEPFGIKSVISHSTTNPQTDVSVKDMPNRSAFGVNPFISQPTTNLQIDMPVKDIPNKSAVGINALISQPTTNPQADVSVKDMPNRPTDGVKFVISQPTINPPTDVLVKNMPNRPTAGVKFVISQPTRNLQTDVLVKDNPNRFAVGVKSIISQPTVNPQTMSVKNMSNMSSMSGMMMGMPMLTRNNVMMMGKMIMRTPGGTPLIGGPCSAGTFCVKPDECDVYTGQIIMDTSRSRRVNVNTPKVPITTCQIKDFTGVCCQLPHPLIGANGQILDK